MADIIRWPVVMACPGEEELTMLADLTSRNDAQVVAVVDPAGDSLGAGLAEVMGIPLCRDLEEIPEGQARFLVHPPLNEQVAALVDLAGAAGMEAVPTREFARRISDPTRGPERVTKTSLHTVDHQLVEAETAAIHKTLSRIEEALDREALLRWLLGLATRATGADSGSIMLFDPATEELYVAFAYGLSQQVMHKTRVRLGQGISGRVALNRKAELIASDLHPGAKRDRSEGGTALSAPLVWDGKLLGVLNISASAETGVLNKDALPVIESLAHRFGMILDRFLRIQMVRDGALFRTMEEDLGRETRNPEAVAFTLTTWAADLAKVAGAQHASLGVLTSDGDLFVAGPDGSCYESPPDDRKSEVLAEGRAVVLRPGDRDREDPTDVLRDRTIFHLPVGQEPVRALFTVEFASPAKAHHFHSISGEVIGLISRHLTDYLDRAATADQVDRLTTLASTLSDLIMWEGPEIPEDRVLAAACRLTGARQAFLLHGEGRPAAAGQGTPEDILTEAAVLLETAGQRGWRATTCEGMEEDEDGRPAPVRTLLAVPLDRGRPFPGLVMLDKERLHPLDGRGFTEFDALFVRRLLPLLVHRQAAVARAVPAQSETKAAEPAAGSLMVDLPGALRREMDRCDRYHTSLGLAAFRLPQAVPDPQGLVGEMRPYLRSSDWVFPLDERTVVVVVPEDVQSLPKLQKRVCGVISRLAGPPEGGITSAARPYPGGATTPQGLLDSVLGLLS